MRHAESMKESNSLFSLPNYPAWFGADTFLLAGSAVHWIVISVMAYQLSGSITVAGWFSTARGIMSVITQVTGGTFIDRHDHRTLILVQAGSCALIWFTMGMLHVAGLLTFPLFAGLCLTSSAIFGFLGGTTNASLIRVVGPSRYAQAESLNQGRDAAVNTAGSPLGAALFGVNQAFPFFASAVCDAVAFVSALFLHLPDISETPATSPEKPGEGAMTSAQTGDQPANKSPSFLIDLIDGWRWVLASKTIVSAVGIVGLCQFAVFALHQAVNLSLVQMGTDPLLISFSNVGMAAGTMVGSVVSMRICNNIPVGRGIVAILALTAVSYLPMALWQNYPAIIVSTFLSSLPMPLFAALANGFVFSKTPVDKQGRTRSAVMTAVMLFASGSGALAGELIPRLGFGGFIYVMIALMTLSATLAALNPRIRRIPASPEWPNVPL